MYINSQEKFGFDTTMPLAEVGAYMNTHAQLCLHESVGKELRAYSSFLSDQFPQLKNSHVPDNWTDDQLPPMSSRISHPIRPRRALSAMPDVRPAPLTYRHGLVKFMGRRNPLGGFYY
jgi:hypothetical protein